MGSIWQCLQASRGVTAGEGFTPGIEGGESPGMLLGITQDTPHKEPCGPEGFISSNTVASSRTWLYKCRLMEIKK